MPGRGYRVTSTSTPGGAAGSTVSPIRSARYGARYRPATFPGGHQSGSAATVELLPSPPAVYWPWILQGSIAQIAATALMLAAMSDRSFVVVYAYIKTEPVQAALFGLVFLGDVVTMPMGIAILIATTGVVLMALKPGTTLDVPAGTPSDLDDLLALHGVGPSAVRRLREALADINRRFDVVAAEAGEKLPAELASIRQQTTALIQRLKKVDRETAEPALTYLQAQLYRDFVSKFYSLQRNLNPRTVSIQDVPADLRRKFVGEDGRFLIQIHPKVDIWEREGAEQFVSELRTVDPEVTGAPEPRHPPPGSRRRRRPGHPA